MQHLVINSANNFYSLLANYSYGALYTNTTTQALSNSTIPSTFGMVMPGRSISSSSYRYGFQGQEKDDEIKGEGNSLNYTYRMHDPRLGRFFAIDPLASKYPHNSSYAFSENSTIAFVELEGLEAYYAASGELLGKFGTSNEIRIIADEQVILFAKALLADGLLANKQAELECEDSKLDLLKSSSKAYTSEIDIKKNWAKQFSALSINQEHAMVIFSKTLEDENGKSFKVFLPGTTTKGNTRQQNPEATADPNESRLQIGKEIIARYYPPREAESGRFRSKYGWERSSIIHTHWAGASDNFSTIGGDLDVSLDWNVPISLVPVSGTWIKTFDPKIYNQQTNMPYKKGKLWQPIDKKAAEIATNKAQL